MTTRLDEVLDRCLEDVRRGRATPEQCLAAYPEHARELAPLLRLAARLDLAPVPGPDSPARHRITAQIRAGLADRGPRRRPFPPVGAESVRRLTLGAAVAAVVLLVLGLGGLLAAAQRAVPGDALYGVKLATERLESALRREDAVDRATRLSGRRLAELETLVRRGDAAHIPEAAERYRRAFGRLLSAAAVAPEDRAMAALRAASAQLVALATLRSQAPAGDALSDVLAALSEQVAGIAALARPAAARPGQTTPAEAAADARAEVRQAGYADLLRAIDAAERLGALAHADAQELRALLGSAAALGLGGDNAVVSASVARLGAAVAACADRACAPPEQIDAVYAAVASSAGALGLPAPPAPVVRRPVPAAPTPTPSAEATSAAAPAPSVAAARPTATPPPARAAATSTAAPAPTVAVPPGTPAPADIAPARPATPAAPTQTAPVTTVPTPVRTPIPPATPTRAAAAATTTAAPPGAGAAVVPSLPPATPGGPMAPGTPATAATPAALATPAHTPTPAPRPPTATSPAVGPAPSPSPVPPALIAPTPPATGPAPSPVSPLPVVPAPPATPTPTPTPTPSPTPTPTPSPTPTPTPSPTPDTAADTLP